MLIKSDKPSRKSTFRNQWAFIAFLVAAATGLFFFVPKNSSPEKTKGETETNAYSVIDKNDLEEIHGEFFSKDGQFRGSELQSSEYAKSGKYSIKLNGENKYGLEYKIPNPKKNEKYRLSVWTYSTGKAKGLFTVTCNDAKIFYKQESVLSQTDNNGWGLIEMYFRVPAVDSLSYIKLFTWVTKDSEDVYFDDIKIEIVEHAHIDQADQPASISINLDDKGYNKLVKKKKKAYRDGILISSEDDWAKALIVDGVSSPPLKAKVRLKGDWLDHLEGDKWSFRVKLKDPYSWHGLMTFSVQTPAARLFLSEWVFHEMLRKEDVLSPRYGFLHMHLNNVDRGVYAYEEHFDKQLVEHSERREGPILKLSENFMWLKRKREKDIFGKNGIIKGSHNSFKSSEIRAFKENRFDENETLKNNFEIAQSLLHGYLAGPLKGHEVFDIDLMAKYYAIIDLNKAYHGNAWHNQRLYYNPVTSKLEPIGYDGFGSAPTGLHRGPFMGYYNGADYDNNLYNKLFEEEDFSRKYNHYINTFSQANYINEFIISIEGKAFENISLIQSEFEDYVFDLNDLATRAKELQFYFQGENNLSLHIKTQNVGGDNKEISCTNVHYLPLDIVGYTYRDKEKIFFLDSPVFLAATRPRALSPTANLQLPTHAKHIVFTVAGVPDNQYTSEILNVSWPKETTPRLFMSRSSELSSISWLVEDSTSVTVKPGRHILNKDLIVPKGKSLILLPGTHIDVVKKAAILIEGPIHASGTIEEPIELVSSDKSAQGLTVLQSDYRSLLKYVTVKDFNTLDREGWTLTGAVTFYEADVDIVDCSFIDVHCEDGLNIIRSDIDINGLYIARTFSDGFDADFCTGVLDKIRFESTGNDAMDFSGSKLKIHNCKIFNAGDKGISVGENANVHVLRAIIKDSNIGVASKDLSYLEIQNISLENCNQGFTLYQKKAEFGPARMNIRYHTMRNVKQPYLVEKGSELRLKGKIVIGE